MQVRERTEALLKALATRDPSERDEVVLQLREIDDPDAIPALIEGLALTGRAQREAIRGLARFGPAARAAIPALCALMAGDDYVDPTYPVYQKKTQWFPSYRVKKHCREALVCIGEAAVEPLLGLLAHDDLHVRIRAATALGDIGDRRAVEPILAQFLDGPPMPPHVVRRAMAYALHRLGAFELALSRLGPLRMQLRDMGNWQQAHECYYHFYILGETAPAPEELLGHVQSGVHYGALDAICKQRRAEAVPTLLRHLHYPPRSHYGWYSFRALGELKATEAVEPLSQIVTGNRGVMREKALEALGAIGASEAVPALLACVREPHNDFTAKQAALQALGQIGGFEATQALLSYAAPGQIEPLVAQAAEGLRRLPRHRLFDEERFALLRELLSHSLSAQVWKLLCAYLSRWPERDDKQIGIDYADEHMEGIDDLVRVIPSDWWDRCLDERPESAWALVRHLKRINEKDVRDGLRARLMHPRMATVTHITLQQMSIKAETIGDIAGSPYLKRLRFLDLSRCGVRESVAFALAEEPFFGQLETLRLIDHRFGRKGRNALRDAAHLSDVRIVT